MFAIGNNELSGLPVLSKTVTCWICGQEHAVEYGEKIAEDGTRQPDDLLAFFKCGEHSYLCGVKGRQLKKPKENIHHLDEYNRPMPQKIDHAAVGREYANNLLGEPAVSKCLHALADEIERLRLTDAERSAVNDAVYLCGATAGLANEQANANEWAKCAATLRDLLERLK